MGGLEGQVVVVTGGSGGSGRAMCARFLDCGARVTSLNLGHTD